MTQVIAIANYGDLTNHTTSVVSLAGALATDALRVLIIEANPEAPLSNYFHAIKESGPTLADLFKDSGMIRKDSLTRLVPVSSKATISMITAGEDLQEVANGLSRNAGKGLLLRNLVNTIEDLHDYVLISCTKNLDVLLVNALAASHTLLLPVNLGNVQAEALAQYLEIVNMIEAGRKMPLRKIALPMAQEMGITPPEETEKELEFLLGDQLWDGVIPSDPHFAQAAEEGVTISELNPKAPGAVAYRRLSEVLT